MAAANAIYLDFVCRGIPDVKKAFRSVLDYAQAAERAQTGKARSESQQRVSLADKEAKAKIAAMQKADRWQRQAQDKATRETDKAAKAEVRAAERKARDVMRVEERKFRDLERWAARHEADQNRRAARWVKTEEQRRATLEADEKRNRRRFAGHLGGAIGGGLQSGVHLIGRAAMGAAGLVGQLGGGFDIASSVQRNAKNAGDVADLINSGVNTFSANKKNHTRRDVGEVNGALDTATMSYGFQRSDAISGLRAYTAKTGDLDSGLKLMPQLAEMSRATGTDLEKLSAAAGQVGLALENIQDPAKKAEAIMQSLRTAGAQGKAGTVELSDMAVQMAKLVAVSNKFEGDNVENLAKMGMLAQFAAGGGGAWSASSAATSVTSFGSVFGKQARVDAFQAKGINPFADAKGTKIKAPEEIIADAFEKTGGSQVEVSKLFGSAMGMRAVNKFGTAYSDGYTGPDGKKLKGREAVLAMASNLTHTTMSKKDVTAAANYRTGQLDVQMARTQEQFDKAVREKIIPMLLQLVPEFERLVPQLVDLNARAIPAFIDLIKTVGNFADAHKDAIQLLADHPFATIIGGALTKSIASAGIAEVFKASISRAMGDAGLGAIFGRVLSSQLGQAGLIVGTAAIAITSGMIAIDKTYEREDAMRDEQRKAQIEAGRLTARIQNGTATPEERVQAGKLVSQLQGQRGALQNDQENPGFWKSMGGGVASLTDEGRQAQIDEQRQQAAQLGDLTKTMRQLEAALRDNTGATKANTPGGNASGPNGPARGTTIVQRNGIK